MNRRRNFIILLVLLAIPVAALVISWWVQTRDVSGEPSWQGRTLRSWLKDCDADMNKLSPAATTAVRAIGTNGIPFLLALMNATNSPRDRIIEKVGFEQQRWKLGLLTTEERRWLTAPAFEALGPMAQPAIPDLLRMFETVPQNRLPALALSMIGSNAIGPLSVTLSSTNGHARKLAARALSFMESTAESAAPALVIASRDSEESVRWSAINALGRCKGDPTIIVPALVINLGDSNRRVQQSALDALGQVGPPASNAVPAITKFATNSSSGLDTRAAAALKRIDPAEAARLGLK